MYAVITFVDKFFVQNYKILPNFRNFIQRNIFLLNLVVFPIFLLPLPPDKIINVRFNIYSNSTMTTTEFSLST